MGRAPNAGQRLGVDRDHILPVPPLRHDYQDHNSGLAEIYLRFATPVVRILMTRSRYPGYVMDYPYREQSAPWFGTCKVARGGCFATPDAVLSYRTFSTPPQRDICDARWVSDDEQCVAQVVRGRRLPLVLRPQWAPRVGGWFSHVRE
jgi:hypothetical protein